MDRPITVERYMYMQALVSVSNNANLPAFVKADVLEMAASQMRSIAEEELKRDVAQYQQVQENNNGGDSDAHDDI